MFRPISQEQLKESTRRQAVIYECLTILTHSRKCKDDNCMSNRCMSMKKVWKHYNSCPESEKTSPKCPICNSVVSLLQYHSNSCQNDSCSIARCRELKADAFSKWQRSQNNFLSNLIKFRLANVPTVIKDRCKKISYSESKVSNGLPTKPVGI